MVARYCARNPVALERLTYDRTAKAVTYRSDNSEGPTAGTETEGGDVPLRQFGGPDGGDRDRRPARVPRPGARAHPRHGPRHDAVLRLVCQSAAWHAGEGGACREGRAARPRPCATAGADRGHPPVGGPASADLRSRPARVPDLPWPYAGRRLHHPSLGDRPDPHPPPRAHRRVRRRAKPPATRAPASRGAARAPRLANASTAP